MTKRDILKVQRKKGKMRDNVITVLFDPHASTDHRVDILSQLASSIDSGLESHPPYISSSDSTLDYVPPPKAFYTEDLDQHSPSSSHKIVSMEYRHKPHDVVPLTKVDDAHDSILHMNALEANLEAEETRFHIPSSRHDDLPVSYTHLTLPTILLV